VLAGRKSKVSLGVDHWSGRIHNLKRKAYTRSMIIGHHTEFSLEVDHRGNQIALQFLAWKGKAIYAIAKD
jgi:hypothetical protein